MILIQRSFSNYKILNWDHVALKIPKSRPIDASYTLCTLNHLNLTLQFILNSSKNNNHKWNKSIRDLFRTKNSLRNATEFGRP